MDVDKTENVRDVAPQPEPADSNRKTSKPELSWTPGYELRPELDPSLTGWVRFWEGSKRTFRDSLDYRAIRRAPFGAIPLIMLILFSAAAGFDAQVFTLAAPDILIDLDINLVPLFNVIGIVNFAAIFVGLGLGFLADRSRRTRMLGIGTVVQGLSSLLTAGSGNLGTFGVAQSVGALGTVGAATPTGSLLSDWYPSSSYVKVVSFARVAGATTGAAAPLAVAWIIKSATADPAHPNWRFPFFISGPLLIVIGILAIFVLKDPIRGYIERRELGVPEGFARVARKPPSFGEAWRTVWSIRTLRRLFISNVVASPATQAIGIFFTLFLFEEYGLDIDQRARLGVLIFLPTIPAAILAGGIGDVIVQRRPQRALVFSGLIGIVGSFSIPITVLEPPLWVLVLQSMVFFAANALLAPVTGALLLGILPSHVRTTGTAIQGLAQVPGAIIYFIVINQLVARLGVKGGLLAAFPLFLVSGIIQLMAAGFFDQDRRSAKASAVADEEWRKAKLEKRAKLLVCRDVDVEYDGVQVLFGIDFDVDEGQLIALLGTNGAGKSTLLRAISGSQEASSGAIVFDGREISHIPPHEIAAMGVIHMPGGRGLFPGLSVRENLLLGNWMNDEKEGASRLEEVLAIFPILKERASERAGSLSGGEQQMLSLAQAFLAKPKLLMIDELSLGLSPAVIAQLIEIVKKINEGGTTVILVEQSVNIALSLAERAIFMEKGEIKFSGETKELMGRPDILRAIYVKGTGALTEGAPASAMKGERERRAYQLEGARSVLEVKEVSKSFGGIQAVSGVSFDLREGEALGLIGPNGAGKTTIFDLVSGYQIPDAGQIIYDGADVTNLPPDERARLRLVRRFQDARLFPALSVYENILVALERKLEVRNVALTALQVPQVREAERRVRRRAERLVELLGLGANRDKFVKELSTGLRRVTDLACVLATEPKVLLLDEPSTGIAQAEAEGLGPLLRQVRFETGCSLLIIEHDMSLISAISDELLAMDQGRAIVRGTPEDVLNDERVIHSYLGASEEAVKRSGIIT